MTRLYEVSRIMWLPGLVNLQGKPACNMQEWLNTANFAPVVSGTNVELQGLETKFLLRAFAGDLNRVSTAGSESLWNIVNIPNIPKSLGWPYVKLYYAALFYAHTILRIWGRSPSYLRTTDLLRVRQAFSAYGITPPMKLQTGQYLLIANVSSDALVIAADKGGGGTHEAIWRAFSSALQQLKMRLATSAYTSSDKVKLDIILAAAESLMSDGGANAAWPSLMRNDIQYRQTEGLWYPYKGRHRSSDFASQAQSLINAGKSAEELVDLSGDSLSRFQAACSFTIAFAREIISDLASAASPQSFLHFGQAQFERSLPT